MRKSLPRLILVIVLIVALILLAIRMWRGVLDLVGAISASGDDDLVAEGAYPEEEIWTPPPYYASDADYDQVSAVREYAEPTQEP